MKIRKATKKDVGFIVSVIKESVLTTHSEIYPKEDMEETLNNYTEEKVLKYIENCDYFVAEDANKIVGCVLAKDDKMRSLYLLPSFMGQGLGRKLAERTEMCIKENGYERVWLWSSLMAHDFYKHIGYKDVKEIPNKHGQVLHIEMEKYFN